MAKAKWNSPQLSEFISSLEDMKQPRYIKGLCGVGLYYTAKEVADEVKTRLQGLRTRTSEVYNLTAKDRRHLLSEKQKSGLIESFGITAMRTSGRGCYDVKLGFDGYNDVITENYPQGQPNALIGRLVESGGTYMDKQPFFRPALNASKARAKQAGVDAVRKKIEETT